jgi:hypothetical protein
VITCSASTTRRRAGRGKKQNWSDSDVSALDRLNRATGVDVLRPGIVGQRRVVRACATLRAGPATPAGIALEK